MAVGGGKGMHVATSFQKLGSCHHLTNPPIAAAVGMLHKMGDCLEQSPTIPRAIGVMVFGYDVA